MVNEKALDALPADSRKALMDALPGYLAALRKGTLGWRHEWPPVADQGRHDRRAGSGRDRATMQKAAGTSRRQWQKRLIPRTQDL